MQFRSKRIFYPLKTKLHATFHVQKNTTALKSWMWLIPLFILLVVLTAPHLSKSMWTDEQRTLWYAGAPPQYGPVQLTESLERIADNVWQAPFYYMVLRIWGAFVGWSEFAIRTLSLFFGLITTAAIYRLTVRHFNHEVGFYAVFTMTVSAFYVNYLHEMRAYMLMMLLMVMMVWAYDRLISTSPDNRQQPYISYAIFTISITAQMYTHYFTVFPIATLGLFHVIFRWRKPRYWQILGCFVFGGGLFLPWIRVFIAGALRSSGDDRRIRNMNLLSMINNLLYMFSNGSIALMVVLLLLAIREWWLSKFVWFILLAGAALVLIATRFFPVLFEIRYLFFMWFPLSILAGIGLMRLREMGIAPSFMLAIWLGFALWHIVDADEQALIHRWYTPPLNELHAALAGRTLSDDVVVLHLPPETPHGNDPDMMAHYMYDLGIRRGRTIPDNYATTDAFYNELVLDAVKDGDRIWLSYETGNRNWRVGNVEEHLLPENNYAFCGEVEKNNAVTVRLFARPPDPDPIIFTGHNPDIEISVYPMTKPLVHDGVAEMGVGWDIPADMLPGQHSIGVHIENTAGQLVSQADFGMRENGYGCAYPQFNDMPPGDYIARLTVYRWENGTRIYAGEEARPVVGEFTLP